MKKLFAITLIVMVILANIAEDAYAKSKSEPTILGAGDIAIIGYNTSTQDEVVVILFLKDIHKGTDIKFTDQGWDARISQQKFVSNSGDGLGYWLADKDYSKGQIKLITFTSGNSTISINSGLPGDQIFIFQGSLSAPILIYGVNINKNPENTWTNNVSPTNVSSGLPEALKKHNFAYNYFNAKYIDKTNFDNVEAAQAAIANTKYWQGDDSAQQTLTFPDFSFGPTAIELNKFASENKPPSSLAGTILTILMAIGIAALLLRTSFKRHNS